MDKQLFLENYESRIKDMIDLDKSLKSNEARLKSVKDEIKDLLLGAGMKKLETAGYKLSVIDASSSLSIDTRAFKKAEPELYVRLQQDYLKVSSRKSYLKLELIN